MSKFSLALKYKKNAARFGSVFSYVLAVLGTYFPVYFPMKKMAPVDCSLIT